MNTHDERPDGHNLDLDQWRSAFSLSCFRCNLESDTPTAFQGRVQPLSIFGLAAADLSLQGGRLERPHRYARADGAEHYCVLIPLTGQSLLVQRDQPVALHAGDIALLDSGQSVAFQDRGNGRVEWIAVRLPRRTLMAHLKFEPQAGLRAPAGTLPGRLLAQLMHEASRPDSVSPTLSEPYMQLTIYDLLGALFTGTHPVPRSAHTEQLFNRVCDIVRSAFSDTELGPSQLAVEAGVSLRYLQMLFTARGLTCTLFIQAIRLDHALRLLRVRNQLNTAQPLSQIAYLCGFRDYNYFGRAFRHRFGCAPGEA
jgi:AraC family transcriptional activator of tynA and feaB